jgi:hypothetical protein
MRSSSSPDSARYARPLLFFVLGAIAVTAVLGLYAVLVPDFGDVQAKILGTSAAISISSILVLACVPAWERRLAGPLPLAGAGLTVVALALVVLGMWTERDSSHYWRLFGTALLLALWCVLTSLLVLARLPARQRWTFFAAAGLTLALALVGIGAMWEGNASSGTGKLAGALAVLSAAFLLVVPVLARAGRGEVTAETHGSDARGYCPRCGAPVSGGGRLTRSCGRCGARFRVTYENEEEALPKQ